MKTCVGLLLLTAVASALPTLSSLRGVDKRHLSLLQEDAEWVSLSEHESFVAAPSQDHRVLEAQRHLAQEYSSQFADAATYYSEVAVAWRMLGLFINCNPDPDKHHRRLQDNNANDQSSGYCARFILWAAYVDPHYEGGGIGEYQYYNPKTQAWDKSACEATNNQRCAQMDCHLATTDFQLLGFFKQTNYDTWMEQLFKHQAYCLWDADQYEFMQGARDWWPDECSKTGQMDGSDYIYTDLKPGVNGTMELGLYTDSACTIEYTGNAVSISSVVDDYEDENAGYSLDQFLEKWNEGFGLFHYCHPCRSYSLPDGGAQGGGENHDGELFACNDAAGYNSVNQCMKFKTKTDPETASYKDVALASLQASIVASHSADVHQTIWGKWGLFIISTIIFVIGVVAYMWAARSSRAVASRESTVSRKPLMMD